MILQSLVALYDELASKGKIARVGWSPVNVGYALCIAQDGGLQQIIPLFTEEERGKKKVQVAQQHEMPSAVKRSSGVAANFLWDNAIYLLGLDSKGDPQRALNCFDACKQLHEQILTGLQGPVAGAVLAFFTQWQPQRAAEHPVVQPLLAELMKGGNLCFRVNGQYPQQDAEIRAAWQAYYAALAGGSTQVCLVTGQRQPIAVLHPSIKGVRGAQTMGASLVSFNAHAFCSYGKDDQKGYNAPVGERAAFAYGAALNYLLADRQRVKQIGDATVVCWAQNSETAYQDTSLAALFGASPPPGLTDDDLKAVLKRIAAGSPVPELDLDPEQPFYILGLAPNAARLSVRFFLRGSFGSFITNIWQHQARMQIVRPSFDHTETLSVWSMLRETVNQNAKDKTPAPNMAADVLRAILTNTHYPATLINGVHLRIRAEHRVTRGRAAIIKAYYLKNTDTRCPEEVLQVELNEQSTYLPYVLGRLFAVLEALQESANGKATIQDKYFNAAASTPATIFPLLLNLAQKHLRKLDTGVAIYYKKQITALEGSISETLPSRMALPAQGAFQLGYYHETQKRYTKKTDTTKKAEDMKEEF